jgi:WD40 repeat protein
MVALLLTNFAFNQRDAADQSALLAEQSANEAAISAAEAEQSAQEEAAQRVLAEEESLARATAQAEAEAAEQDALAAEQVALDAEHNARLQASIGLAGQVQNEMNGSYPERAIPLALEAMENYPYTWQAELSLGLAVLNHKLVMEIPLDGGSESLELSADGLRLLSCAGGVVRILDAVTGETILTIDEGAPRAAVWSPDETAILTIDTYEAEFTIKLWDAVTGELRYTVETDSKIAALWFWWIPWSPEGDRFVTAHEDGSARIWDAATGTELRRLQGNKGAVEQAAWSPAQDHIVTIHAEPIMTGTNGSAILWDAATGESLFSFPGTRWTIRFGSWAADGNRFSLRGIDRVSIFDTTTGAEVELSYPGVWSQHAVLSPDGSKLVTSSYQNPSARLWNAETGAVIQVIPGLGNGVAVNWSPSGTYAAVAGADGLVRIMDGEFGVELDKVTFSEIARKIEWSPEEDKLYLAGPNVPSIKVYQLSKSLLTITNKEYMTSYMDWSPDGKMIGWGAATGESVIYLASTGEERLRLNSGNEQAYSVSFSPSSDRILTGNEDGTVRIWEAHNGDLLVELTGHQTAVNWGDWSPDGARVATAGYKDGKVIVWDAASGAQIWVYDAQPFEDDGAVVVVWSPDGSRIVTTRKSGEGTILDAATGEVTLQLFDEEDEVAVGGAAWSPDGSQVVVFKAEIGNLFDASSGELLQTYIGHSSPVEDLYWSPDGEKLYTFSWGGTARVFDIATGIELIRYETVDWCTGALSPDGTRMAISDGSNLEIYPTWQTTEELIAYAKECCTIYELTAEERVLFGLDVGQ